ncbi:MAG TPA: CDP-diacylglycerol diphosphatase [Methylovirgula sp.]|jgi:CDP-diacylglycerol pyrophosphatase
MPKFGPKLKKALAALVLMAAALVAFLFLSPPHNRNALWTIVHDKCVPDEMQHRDPAPCARVELSNGEDKGYAILKDIRGAAQHLLIPTRRIPGIESADLLAPDAPNYWKEAWDNRNFLSARLKQNLAWDKTGLAVNSAHARGQDQLHIHIDCVLPDVRDALKAHIGDITSDWKQLSFDLEGLTYFARRLAASDLARQNPFTLVAKGVPDMVERMGEESVALIGVSFPEGEDGFVLLAGKVDPKTLDRMHSEILLDHKCAVARSK